MDIVALPIYQKDLTTRKRMKGRILTKIPTDLITIGDHIRKKRIELDIFQKEVAEIIDVSEDCITFWEKGRSSPQKRYLEKIKLFLGYDPLSTQK